MSDAPERLEAAIAAAIARAERAETELAEARAEMIKDQHRLHAAWWRRMWWKARAEKAEAALVQRDERRGMEIRLMANKIECQRGEIRNLHRVIDDLKTQMENASVQIEYLDECSPSGTSPTILARIRAALAKIAALKGGEA